MQVDYKEIQEEEEEEEEEKKKEKMEQNDGWSLTISLGRSA